MLGKKTTTLIQATIDNKDNKDDDNDKSFDGSLSKGYKSPEMHPYGPVYMASKGLQVGEVTRLGGVARLTI